MLKGLPLAYNKDMQEDKEIIFDAFETVQKCLTIFAPMVETMEAIPENMLSAAGGGFINATDLADYLTKKGMPFRSAYKLTGMIVAYCVKSGKMLEGMTLAEYKSFSDSFEADLYEAISLKACVERRTSAGGPGKESIMKQIEYLKKVIG